MIAQAAFMALLRRLDRIVTGWHRLMMPKQTALPRIPVYDSIIDRPIQSLLSQRTARSGRSLPCRRARAS